MARIKYVLNERRRAALQAEEILAEEAKGEEGIPLSVEASKRPSRPRPRLSKPRQGSQDARDGFMEPPSPLVEEQQTVNG